MHIVQYQNPHAQSIVTSAIECSGLAQGMDALNAAEPACRLPAMECELAIIIQEATKELVSQGERGVLEQHQLAHVRTIGARGKYCAPKRRSIRSGKSRFAFISAANRKRSGPPSKSRPSGWYPVGARRKAHRLRLWYKQPWLSNYLANKRHAEFVRVRLPFKLAVQPTRRVRGKQDVYLQTLKAASARSEPIGDARSEPVADVMSARSEPVGDARSAPVADVMSARSETIASPQQPTQEMQQHPQPPQTPADPNTFQSGSLIAAEELAFWQTRARMAEKRADNSEGKIEQLTVALKDAQQDSIGKQRIGFRAAMRMKLVAPN